MTEDLAQVRAIAAVILSAGITWILLKASLRFPWGLPLDHPNHRSLHSIPIPRIGGLTITAGVVAGALVARPAVALWPLACAAVLTAVSFLDDCRSLPMSLRLLVHLAVAGAFTSFGLHAPLEVWQAAAVTLGIVWMTNLFNFMDGADGLAGGMAAIGFAFLAMPLLSAGEMQLGTLCGLIVACSFIFLFFNFSPARVFMGDAGSIPLGFLVGAIGLYGWALKVWPLWYPAVVFLPFIADTSLTLAVRIVRRQKFWQAHRDHYYQRAIRMGWSHRSVAVTEYGLMVFAGGTAWLLLKASPLVGGSAATALGVVFLLLLVGIDARWRELQSPIESSARERRT